MDKADSVDPAEEQRLALLHALDLLDTAPEEEFDAVARLAGAVTGCPTAVVNLADRDRMWIKAIVGDAAPETPRDIAVCDTTIRHDALLMVEDMTCDPRFGHLPAVTAGLRFYAGLPFHALGEDGVKRAMGTICVVDTVPRRLTDGQRRGLIDLVALTEALIASRGIARKAVEHAVALERHQRIFRQAERIARIGWWRLNLDDERIEWSDGVFRIHDLDPGEDPSLAAAIDFYPPDARAIVSRSLAHTLETGQSFDMEVDFVSARGIERRVRSMGEIEWLDGRPAAVIGVFQDVSEEYALSQELRRNADSDPLTDIPNRTVFNRRLEAAITAARADATPLALVLIDLDNFKRVNDTFGHPVGDEVLKTVAGRLQAPWLKDCCSSRLGGDEFAIIVDAPDVLEDDDALIARLESELRMTTTIDGLTMDTGASVGLTRFNGARHASLRAFVHDADAALYAAKRRRVGDRRAA